MVTTTTYTAQPILGITTMETVGYGVVRGLVTDLHLQYGVHITSIMGPVLASTMVDFITAIIVGDC